MASYYGDKPRDIPSWDSLENGDDDDTLEQSEYQYAARDHLLFCIDASQSMQIPLADTENPEGIVRGRSPLHQALEAVMNIQRSKVITGPADSVGLLLYNVDAGKLPSSTSSGDQKPGTLVFSPIRTINAEEIKRVIKLLQKAEAEYQDQNEDDPKTVQPPFLGTTFPPCSKEDELNVADVFRTCNFLFRDAGTKLTGPKRLFLVTDNDQPAGSEHSTKAAETTYQDLTSYGVSINTYFVDRPDHRFDPSLYWNHVLGRPANEGVSTAEDSNSDGLEQLTTQMSDLVIKNAPKRTQFSIPLKLGGRNGEIEIGVNGYSLISVQGKGQPKMVRMRGQTVEEIQLRTEYTSAETGAVLKDEEVGQAYQFGHESTIKNILEPNWWESEEHQQQQRMIADEVLQADVERRRREDAGEEIDVEEQEVPAKTNGHSEDKPKVVARTRLQFTSDEIAQFKSMGMSPQIKILGFRSPDDLEIDDNMKHAYFLYPNEETYTGSTRTFAALLKSCIKLNRHALAICRFKTNITPEICCLIPQEETFSDDGGQDQPPGFHVIVLPFTDDIRQPPKVMTANLSATDEQANLMGAIVKRLRTKAARYRSDVFPNPALGYHQAQLQALAFEEDFDEELFDDRTIPKYEAFHRIAGQFMKEWNAAIDEDERAVEKLVTSTKRAAVEVAEDELQDVEAAFTTGTIGKLKVQDLKDYAKFHKVSLTGKTKKADIIEALTDFLEKRTSGKKAKK
ncbi:ATP-dependent DNA helicase 2 subunit 1, partial [Tremellales sp. Uapishka_1]